MKLKLLIFSPFGRMVPRKEIILISCCFCWMLVPLHTATPCIWTLENLCRLGVDMLGHREPMSDVADSLSQVIFVFLVFWGYGKVS